jgi:hypothetical protein
MDCARRVLRVLPLVSLIAASPANAMVNEWSEDQIGHLPPCETHYFRDLDKDGNPETGYADLDCDGIPEQGYEDTDDDGVWDTCMRDANEDGKWESGKGDKKPNGTAGGDGKWNAEWVDFNGDGDCLDPGELGEIPPEDIGQIGRPGGELICPPGPNCFDDFAPIPDLAACALVDVPWRDLTLEAFSPAHPNPTHREVRFQLALGQARYISIDVYDVSGRWVTRLFKGMLGPGEHTVRWDGHDASGVSTPPGVYIVRAATSGFTSARHVLRLR